jgi:hypothetical protein
MRRRLVRIAGYLSAGVVTAAVGLAVTVAALAGCTVTVEPPTDVADPVTVFLLDHDRHASLVLPTDQPGTYINYATGDWEYYALNNASAFNALAALLLPTDTGLGRRPIVCPPSLRQVVANTPVPTDEAFAIEVDRAKVRALRDDLDAVFEAADHEPVFNDAYDLTFVKHPQTYSLFRDSNRMVADWLETLDCRVSGIVVWSDWQVDRAQAYRAAGDPQ